MFSLDGFLHNLTLAGNEASNNAMNVFSPKWSATFPYTSFLPQAKDNKQRKEGCNLTSLGEIINKNEEGICLFFHSKSRRG